MVPVLTSMRNPTVKRLRSLRLRKGREREGSFLIEGIRIVGEALDRGARVETLVYAPDLLISERARSLVERVDASRRLALAGDLFRSLSDREEPQGLAAVVSIEDRTLAAIPPAPDLLVVAACQLQDPGNLGSVIRTADAVGAAGVVVVEPSVDLYDPETVRSTMGSLFALPVVRVPGSAALVAWCAQLREAGLALLLVASSARAERIHFDVDYCRPVVLMVGNERTGLPPELRMAADVAVRLPMVGRATSLNVSAATAALLYEVVRQRRESSGGAPPGAPS